MKFPLLMTCLGFSFTVPQFPPGPAPGYFYPPLPYGPPPLPPFPYLHSNITTALRSSSPVSPFTLPQSPPYSGPVFSLPSGPPYLPLSPSHHHLPPQHLPQHPLSYPQPLSPLAAPRPP